MGAMQAFNFEDKAVRSLLRDDEPWFVGKDICAALGLKGDVGQHTRRLDEDEKGLITDQTLGGVQEISIISEPGVYRLVFTSRTEGAERFKRWLAHDVLPVLRRTGRFEVSPLDEDELPRLEHGQLWGQPVAKINAAARLIGVANRIYGPEAARALWEREKGLPKLAKLSITALSGHASDDPTGCWKHLMRSSAGDGRTVGQILDLALHDKMTATKTLPSYGMMFVGTGANSFLAIANQSRFLASAFAATQWADDWRLAFCQLPGAAPAKAAMRFDGEDRTKGVLIPKSSVLKLRNPTH